MFATDLTEFPVCPQCGHEHDKPDDDAGPQLLTCDKCETAYMCEVVVDIKYTTTILLTPAKREGAQ